MRGRISITMSVSVRITAQCALVFFGISLCVGAAAPEVRAAEIEKYSDTISDSAPGEYANHTIRFTLREALAPGENIRVTPTPGAFTIPAGSFSHRNVELYVATSSDGLQPRGATSTASASKDGVSVTSGQNGSVEYTLNSSVGIPANTEVALRLGTHTTHATTGDLGIKNPTTSPQSYGIELTVGSIDPDVYRPYIAIVDNVSTGDVDTTEVIPPERFNGAPTGELSGTTQNVEVSFETNELARCRYATASGTPFFSMSNQVSSDFSIVHSFVISVATSTTYDLFIKCIDDESNENNDDYLISFSVPEFPEGTPGDTGDEEGQGGDSDGTGADGDADGSTGESDNEADDDAAGGEGGGGDEDTGSGGGGGGSSGGGSGGGSGGSGGGGFTGSGPYQSGDGQVIINGYGFPDSEVVILIDGEIAETTTAKDDAKFSATIEEIAAGTYTFGIYAVDEREVQSSTFSTSFLVTGSRNSTLSNVQISPSVDVEPDPVDPGETLTVSGYTLPNADVTINSMVYVPWSL